MNATGTGWTEKGLTWKTAPAKGALLATTPTLPAGAWVEFDVTSAVSGNGTFAFLVSKTSGTDGADVKSREQTPNGPQLVVTPTGDDDHDDLLHHHVDQHLDVDQHHDLDQHDHVDQHARRSTTTTSTSTSTTSTTLPPPTSGPLAFPPTDTTGGPATPSGAATATTSASTRPTRTGCCSSPTSAGCTSRPTAAPPGSPADGP